jgi:predicted membrane protein
MIHGMDDGTTIGRRGAPLTMRLVFGLAVMGVGLLLTLDNFGLLEARRIIRWWPLLVAAAGLAKLFSPDPRTRHGGGLVAAIGILLLLLNLGFVASGLALPLFLLVMGAALVLRAILNPDAAAILPETSGQLDASAFLGYVQRAIGARDFTGGNVWAVMGGCEIDLTKASIERGRAAIHTFAFWGGIEMKVPPDWMVESRGVAVLGAFEDASRRPDDDRKTLVVTGYALMGGVEIKN